MSLGSRPPLRPLSSNHHLPTQRESASRFFASNAADDIVSVTRRFKKEDLQHAIVIGQVDRCFISCTITPRATSSDLLTASDLHKSTETGDTTIVLVDQHAADERVRVERFLVETCLGFLNWNIPRRELSDPVPVLLTRSEVTSFGSLDGAVLRAFDRWGFRVRVPAPSGPSVTIDCSTIYSGSSSSDYAQVYVETVPEVVADKVRLHRCLYKDFLNLKSGTAVNG